MCENRVHSELLLCVVFEVSWICLILITPGGVSSQIVGCDHELGSAAKEDNCGVCNGDGSSCRLVRGHYKSQHASGKSKENAPRQIFFVRNEKHHLAFVFGLNDDTNIEPSKMPHKDRLVGIYRSFNVLFVPVHLSY